MAWMFLFEVGHYYQDYTISGRSIEGNECGTSMMPLYRFSSFDGQYAYYSMSGKNSSKT